MLTVSVIVPAHNEERYIQKTLESLITQSAPVNSYELLVIANGCTDSTVKIAKNFKAATKHVTVKVLETTTANVSVARNLGAMYARNELLIFLDADTTLESSAVEQIARTFKNESSVGTCKGKPDTHRLLYYCILTAKNILHKLQIYKGSSGTIICRKAQFKQVKGFNESLEVKEDKDLINKLSAVGKYQYFSCTATTSMRRFEQQGAIKLAWFWIVQYYKKYQGKLAETRYEKIR